MTTMTVRRDGYWDGQYARAGDTITVDDETLVETLEVAGFAVREAVGPPPETRPVKPAAGKERRYGR